MHRSSLFVVHPLACWLRMVKSLLGSCVSCTCVRAAPLGRLAEGARCRTAAAKGWRADWVGGLPPPVSSRSIARLRCTQHESNTKYGNTAAAQEIRLACVWFLNGSCCDLDLIDRHPPPYIHSYGVYIVVFTTRTTPCAISKAAWSYN